ncbi:MAG TPA: hypothetical protein VNW30_10110 [Opitutaceae bacterium]|nr:hypothetical protein [Opitutaceae bacterium]
MKARNTRDQESERAIFLHEVFLKIKKRIANGDTLKSAIAWAARRRNFRLIREGMLGENRLVALYYIWRQNPSPKVFHRHYKGPERRIPIDLALEALNRMAGDKVRPAAIVIRELRNDFSAGQRITDATLKLLASIDAFNNRFELLLFRLRTRHWETSNAAAILEFKAEGTSAKAAGSN